MLGKTKSICPGCLKSVDAILVDNKGKVVMEKTCPEHGLFTDEVWGDASHYKKLMQYYKPEDGQNPDCPQACLCPSHLSNTLLGIVDVTAGCNLACPVCFAADAKQEDPTMMQVKGMLSRLRSQDPPAYAVQFSGGEPTQRDDLPEIISTAHGMGFKHTQVNTNGVRLGLEKDYARRLKQAGLKAAYLQFDGLDDDVYLKLRGRPLLDVKLEAVENCRNGGLDNIVLVLTLVKGVNEGQLGPVIDFAVRNRDIVRCVNVQPVSFVGRHPGKERITSHDFIRLVEEQTGGRIRMEHFKPISCVNPVTDFAGQAFGKKFPSFSVHPLCGLATYLVGTDDAYNVINNLLDVDGFLRAVESAARRLSKDSSPVGRVRAWAPILQKILPGVRDPVIRDLLVGVLKTGSWDALRQFHYNTVLVSCMHFMDAGNFDLERSRRCVVHYSRPEGIIPFCAYNVVHR